MGHTLTADSDLTYQRLQERLDRLPTGAPDSPVFQRILRLLFTEQEAQVAAVMPTLGTLEQVASRTGRSVPELEPMVEEMARKGLVFDLRHRGRRWVSLAPVVIGFYGAGACGSRRGDHQPGGPRHPRRGKGGRAGSDRRQRAGARDVHVQLLR